MNDNDTREGLLSPMRVGLDIYRAQTEHARLIIEGLTFLAGLDEERRRWRREQGVPPLPPYVGHRVREHARATLLSRMFRDPATCPLHGLLETYVVGDLGAIQLFQRLRPPL